MGSTREQSVNINDVGLARRDHQRRSPNCRMLLYFVDRSLHCIAECHQQFDLHDGEDDGDQSRYMPGVSGGKFITRRPLHPLCHDRKSTIGRHKMLHGTSRQNKSTAEQGVRPIPPLSCDLNVDLVNPAIPSVVYAWAISYVYA